ncbi:MAG: DUF169 domain-containing protein [Deltaproteobacteria bacterium]|jgi:uncharacterized protein (DUF169 family)|nr:DUF169 domain-containing protein [Deltaproteobacteria bacterium]
MTEQLNNLDVTLRDFIKPQTQPIAIKLLEKGSEIPPKFKRPTSFQGYALGLCQGITIARTYGWSLAYRIDDMACGPSLSYFGFIEVPPYQAEGGLVYPMYAKNQEGGQRSEAVIDRLPTGKIETILVAPLGRASFSPDVVMVYGNAAQMARLIQGALYCHGGGIRSVFAGRCACTAEIITPLVKDDYNVVIPDAGERIFGLAGNDELVFSCPGTKIDDLIEGITTTHKSGVARYPYPVYGLRMAPQYPEKYEPLVEMARLKSASAKGGPTD